MQRYVVTGLSRLALRVTEELAHLGGHVTVVVENGTDEHLVADVAEVATVVPGGGDRSAALAAAGLAGADALLALGDDDLDNLRSVASAATVGPEVPVVLRSFDAAVADQLELSSNVRRAFSLSGLAAPAFVAAALGDQTLQTLRLGRDEIPLIRATVGDAGPLTGSTPESVYAASGVRVIARGGPTDWSVCSEGEASLATGEEVLLGGRLVDVFGVALANSPLEAPPESEMSRRSLSVDAEDALPSRSVTATLLPATAIALGLLLLGGSIAFGFARHLSPLEALYFTITTAWGDPGVAGSDAWQQMFGLVLMVSVGALVGVLFSHLAAVATEERMASRMHRRAARMQGHVIVAGLGTIGYRICRLLHQLGIPVVAIDRDPDSRFVGAASAHGPVVIGDARLPEDLARAGVARAACLLAVTGDDLVNITACLQTEAFNRGIRSVARIFDDTVAESAGPALGIDVVVSASRVAAPAFVGAAVDDRAARRVDLDGLHLVAARHDFADGRPSDAHLAAWRAEGVQVVASNGDAAVIVGPQGAVALRQLLDS
jgi:Trk K+ transport system NAD-binding subunit